MKGRLNYIEVKPYTITRLNWTQRPQISYCGNNVDEFLHGKSLTRLDSRAPTHTHTEAPMLTLAYRHTRIHVHTIISIHNTRVPPPSPCILETPRSHRLRERASANDNNGPLHQAIRGATETVPKWMQGQGQWTVFDTFTHTISHSTSGWESSRWCELVDSDHSLWCTYVH